MLAGSFWVFTKYQVLWKLLSMNYLIQSLQGTMEVSTVITCWELRKLRLRSLCHPDRGGGSQGVSPVPTTRPLLQDDIYAVVWGSPKWILRQGFECSLFGMWSQGRGRGWGSETQFIWDVIPEKRKGVRKWDRRKPVYVALVGRSPLWAAGLSPARDQGRLGSKYLHVNLQGGGQQAG